MGEIKLAEKRSGRCFVFGAGERTRLWPGGGEPRSGDWVIAVDGGFAWCRELGLEPELVIGDFDSLPEGELEGLKRLEQGSPQRVRRLQPEKDDTDMLAALRSGLESGCGRFFIYGGTGGRLDHTIANIQCLLFLKSRGAEGYLMGDKNILFALCGEEVTFPKGTAGILSLFSLGREARDVTIRGLKYPLDRYTMRSDYPIGVSNEFAGLEGSVSVGDGELLAVFTPSPAFGEEPSLQLPM